MSPQHLLSWRQTRPYLPSKCDNCQLDGLCLSPCGLPLILRLAPFQLDKHHAALSAPLRFRDPLATSTPASELGNPQMTTGMHVSCKYDVIKCLLHGTSQLGSPVSVGYSPPRLGVTQKQTADSTPALPCRRWDDAMRGCYPRGSLWLGCVMLCSAQGVCHAWSALHIRSQYGVEKR